MGRIINYVTLSIVNCSFLSRGHSRRRKFNIGQPAELD